MAKVTIKAGEPQPKNCKKCKGKMGYKLSERIKTHMDTIFTENGDYDGCFYSEMPVVLLKYKTASCANCNSILPFNLA